MRFRKGSRRGRKGCRPCRAYMMTLVLSLLSLPRSDAIGRIMKRTIGCCVARSSAPPPCEGEGEGEGEGVCGSEDEGVEGEGVRVNGEGGGCLQEDSDGLGVCVVRVGQEG